MSNFSIFNHTVATTQCKTGNQPLLPGNIVPHSWYKKFRDNSGNPDLIAISILADIVAWNRFGTNDYYGDNAPRFDGTFLCVSYDYFEEKFCLSKDRIRRAFVRLETLNVLTRKVRNIRLSTGSRVNRVLITIDQDFFNSCFSNNDFDIRVKSQVNHNNSTTSKNLSFSAITSTLSNSEIISIPNTSNNFNYSDESKITATRSLDGCNDHISNKNYNKRIRSIELPSLNTTISKTSSDIKSNFLKNNLFLKQEILVEQPSKQSKFVKPKELKDFYPLSKEDCSLLQAKSGRDFCLRAMNEILSDMSKRLSDRYFKSKNAFISYMSKAFSNEMRDPFKINNETFRIRSNLTTEEINFKDQEQFLAKIENIQEVSPEVHFKKKLACVLNPAKSYELLKAYKRISFDKSVFQIHLYKPVLLSEFEKEIILKQVKATHDRFTNGELVTFDKLEILMPEKSVFEERKGRVPNIKTQTLTTPIPDTTWGKVRKNLISLYGEVIDRHWFSKLAAEVKEESRAIHLKAPTNFIRDYIVREYLASIERISKSEEYRVTFA